MKRILLFLCLTVSCLSAFAQTNVGGTINTNTTWSLAGSPYTVTSTVTVANGFTLTVDQDVVVKFNDGLSMVVNGTINATGATFTAANASPSAGVIGALRVGNYNTSDGGTGNFTNCVFQYFQSVKLELGDATFTGCSFSNFSQYGIESYNNSTLTVSGGTMTNIATAGNYSMLRLFDTSVNEISNFSMVGDDNSNEVVIDEASTATFENVSIQTSTGNALWLGTLDTVTISNSNFGGAQYPIYLSRDGIPVIYSGTNTFTGNTYDAVYFADNEINVNTTLNNPGVPYRIAGSVLVKTGFTFEIEPGSIVKFSPSNYLRVQGTLVAEGTVTDRIYFTSLYDDNLGGDTNNDANSTGPTNGKWYGIQFYNEADDASVVSYSDVRYISSYGGVTLTNASPTIDNCNFSTCYYGALFEEDSNPTFTNNVIAGSERTPIAMSFEADPTFSNNQFSTSDNDYDAIGLLGGTLTADAAIIKRDFTDLPNVTYVMLNHITIPAARTLSIAPGVVIKSLSGYRFYVNGKLLVNGTSSENVVFTSVNDDNFGNPLDTRNDGTSQTPAVGNFGGFYFSETASSQSLIDYAAIRFASVNDSYNNVIRNYPYAGAIAVYNSSPTISNSKIFQSNYGVDVRGLASPIISNNNITNTVYAPLRFAIQATPALSGNTFASLGWRGIAILPEVINYTATLSKRNVDGLFDNITYIMTDLYINTGAQITLDSGLVVKIDVNQDIEVHGGLKVKGTSDARVLFTSIADDNAGASLNPTDNDTQGNGNATAPVDNEYYGIVFEAGSDDAFSSIEYADFHFGGRSQGPVVWNSASAAIRHVNIRYSENYGLYFTGNSSPIVDDVFIQSSRYDPLAMSFLSNPTFSDIVFDANGSNGIRLIDTEVGANATLYKRDIAGITNIAYVSGGFIVHSGAELTINPGVVIKMTTASIGIREGKIHAEGTASEKIIFTSINDDSRGGDTNNNGNATPPAKGNWGGIDARASSKQTVFRYCEFRYGSTADQVFHYTEHLPYPGMVRAHNNNMIVDNCVVQFTNNIALGAYGTSTATFTNNSIQNVTNEALAMHMFADPVLSGNTLENVGIVAIRIESENFTQNRTLPFRSFAGYDSITYTIAYPGLVIATGTTITVPAGMHFKSDYSVFTVNGNLQVAGTESDPVVFTAPRDDSYGRPKDTHQDGIQTVYTTSYSWIVFNNISDDNSVVDHALLVNGGGGVSLYSASPALSNNIFEKCNYGIGMEGVCEPSIDYNIFRNLTYTPFATSMISYPSSTEGNTMEGTTWKAIRINDETLTQDTVLVKRPFGGVNNIPYVMGGYNVGPGVTLKIDPGVIIKFTNRWAYPYNDGYLTISGALEAIGGPDADSTIVFTAIENDFYGGDTNSNGPPTSSYGTFQGVTFNNESSDALSKLDHVIISASRYNGLILNSASPTISNSSFRSNNQYGMELTGASNPVLTANDFIDNGSTYEPYRFGIYNSGSFVVNATGSWWGHNSGPYHATSNPDGLGQKVSDNVTFDPWATNLSLNPVTGDVSLNGMVSAYDASLALQSVVDIITLEERQIFSGDVTGDDDVTAMDASYILQYSAGLITNFPAESTNKRMSTTETQSQVKALLADAEISSMDQVIEIPFTIADVEKLYAMEFYVKLDEELEFVAFDKGTAAVNYITNYNAAEKTLKIAFAGTTPATESGLLGTLKVKAATSLFTKEALAVNFSHAVGNATDVLSISKSARISLSPQLLEETKTAFKVYPNPAAEFFDLTLKPSYEGPVDVKMMDRTGKVLTNFQFNKEKGFTSQRINFRAERGIYVLKIKTTEGLITSKIVVGQ